MGSKMRQGRETLAAMLAVSGEDAMIDMISLAVSEGKTPQDIAADLGVVVSCVWEWMRAAPPRIAAYRTALKAWADTQAHESLRDVQDADADTVPLARLRAEHRLKLASKWDRETYGETPPGTGGTGGITVIVDRDSALSIEGPDGSVLTVEPSATAVPTSPQSLETA